MLLVDSNVLIDVLEDDSEWAAWSIAQLRTQSQIHALAINPIIYAEISCAFARIEELERVVAQLQLQVLELPRPALFLAGKANTSAQRAHDKACCPISSSAPTPPSSSHQSSRAMRRDIGLIFRRWR
jgi:predicted nucleic acid-binding protein